MSPASHDYPVQVMLVEDSAVTRAIFSRIIKACDDVALVAMAHDAESAIEQLRKNPVEVILLDLEMPGMGGLAALPQIMAIHPRARVLVVSSLTVEGAKQTVEALRLGAADTLAKPTAGNFDAEYGERLISRVRALGRTARLRRAQAQGLAAEPGSIILARPGRKRAKTLALGASTGGIHALGEFLENLPRRIGIPILITQHLPATFMDAMVRQIQAASGRETMLAAEGTALVADRILIAPGHAHIRVTNRCGKIVTRLDTRQWPNGCLPSVDPMFMTLAEEYEGHVLGVVMSGMGRDGTDGAQSIVNSGGSVMAQDEASSAVWGMPGSVVRAGLACSSLPPAQLAAAVAMATNARMQ